MDPKTNTETTIGAAYAESDKTLHRTNPHDTGDAALDNLLWELDQLRDQQNAQAREIASLYMQSAGLRKSVVLLVTFMVEHIGLEEEVMSRFGTVASESLGELAGTDFSDVDPLEPVDSVVPAFTAQEVQEVLSRLIESGSVTEQFPTAPADMPVPNVGLEAVRHVVKVLHELVHVHTQINSDNPDVDPTVDERVIRSTLAYLNGFQRMMRGHIPVGLDRQITELNDFVEHVESMDDPEGASLIEEDEPNEEEEPATSTRSTEA